MNIFINECSLHSQYHSQDAFLDAVKVFYSVVKRISKSKKQSYFFKSSDLFTNFRALKEEIFVKSLNTIPDKSFKVALRNALFNKETVVDWTAKRFHSPEDVFECNGDIVTDTSMAELAERKLGNDELIAALLNFKNSCYTDCPEVTVVKERKEEIDLECVESVETLQRWLDRHSLDNRYQESSSEPPLDHQTFLDDRQRFERASCPRQGGRQVYLDKSTGYFWYVDSLHFGNAAHLEVFDKNLNHIGEASLDGVIFSDKADKTKKLDI